MRRTPSMQWAEPLPLSSSADRVSGAAQSSSGEPGSHHNLAFLVDASQMSAADFLLSPEVQKLLKIVFAQPNSKFSVGELAKKTKLDAGDVERTQEHLIGSGILSRHNANEDETSTVSVNTSFVFYRELRSIALKSFAAAEPIRAMLRSKFKNSVLRAFLLGEDTDATVELLVVHGELVPDESEMAAACQKLSASIGRHLKVQVISGKRFAVLAARDNLHLKLEAGSVVELIAEGDTKAKPSIDRGGLLQSARNRLAALAR
ncbi:hypothetical protein QTH90_31350 [Variovorax sp. J2P1-59]|uniref:hypothetical protein n=1 Tax=Variovorax flavidus TaxID=3053501 RepID=UPI0025758BF2|nr:hypothetical protein [Variovorax sp. J2P1-59]MDM0078938.1 hypothetical protein [Variovorax sp. J2P1-59]